jgi:hypothetical protein
MVLVRERGNLHPLVVGPLKTAGVATWGEGAEILWIKFKLGVFMPRFPVRDLLDRETHLDEATGRSFWLSGSVWEAPAYENADTFVKRLVREGLLVQDPLIPTVLQNQLPEMAPRTVRHRFLQATGLTQTRIRQIKRAQEAAALLAQGVSILDTVHLAGYFDQPHLTRALKQWVGYTPAQIFHAPDHSP